ncbi:Grx4 family monothiol glutaredoxin [Thermoleophilum album]|jgi:monothiol glutaredoxin|uniref:Grx4 family monothiol glutaredoxin n=1 Tax=Thermoleophilum album TaxID=29539 RepID=UPI00237C56B0|nr:Grx4 family monothiol glutaredoxin [Thermoleophilum album]WDT93378.1 Grx4 family monothiol glutaredoxin [Thermoleophilum album]
MTEPSLNNDELTRQEIREFIERAIRENRVMLFMKGTPDQPRCGFSARVAAILSGLGVRYAAMDILPDPRIREELSALSGWPTIPQLFVDGELIGGCDIVTEMFESGELQELLGVDASANEGDDSARGQRTEPSPPAADTPSGPAARPIPLENNLRDD